MLECDACHGKGCAECDGHGNYEVYAGDLEAPSDGRE